MPTLMKTKDAAEYLGVEPTTMATWRSKKAGPKYTGSRKLIRYLKSDLDDYLDSKKSESDGVRK